MRLAILCIFVFVLASCYSSRSEYYYFTHPKTLNKVLQQCHEGAMQGEACERAKSAGLELETLIHHFLEDQSAYGQQILKAQIALAKTREELPATENEKQRTSLEASIQKQEQAIKKMKFVIGLYVKFE
ncbi:MAG: EexN family lipoprotein [Gammaproteobacteria bacterium]